MLTCNQTLIAASYPDDLTRLLGPPADAAARTEEPQPVEQSGHCAPRDAHFHPPALISIPFPPFNSTASFPYSFIILRVHRLTAGVPRHCCFSFLRTPSLTRITSHIHHAPSVPPSILVTDTSTDTNSHTALPPRPWVEPQVRRDRRPVPVPMDAEVRLP
jgi:hypothetical protein